MLVCECLDDSIRTLTHMGPSTQFRFAITSHAHTRSPKALAGPNQAAIVKLERLPQSMMVQMRSLTHPPTHSHIHIDNTRTLSVLCGIYVCSRSLCLYPSL